MPVIKQKAEEVSDIQTGPPLNGNTLRHTLEVFRNHHDACSRRRKNGVSYEIRVEVERSKWLKRKYMDNLRQQQALSGRLEAPRTHLSSSSDSAENSMETINIKQSPGLPDTPPPEKHQPGHTPQRRACTPDGASSGSEQPSHDDQLSGFALANGHQNPLENNFASVAVKSEPNSAENTPTCLKSPPQLNSMANLSRSRKRTPPGSISLSGTNSNDSGGLRTTEAKRRKVLNTSRSPKEIRRPACIPLSRRSLSSPDDLGEDDLALSPRRFIHGVLSTPPIKPLEEGDDPPLTPSPPSTAWLNKSGDSSSTNLPTSTNGNVSAAITSQESTSVSAGGGSTTRSMSATVPAPTSVTATNAKDSSLFKDLHDFDQIVYQITREQSAKERQASLSSPHLYSTSSSTSGVMTPHTQVQAYHQAGTHIMSPPPYYPADASQSISLHPSVSSPRYYNPAPLTSLHRRPVPPNLPFPHHGMPLVSPSSPVHLFPPPFTTPLQMHTHVVPTSPFSHPQHPQSPNLIRPQPRPPAPSEHTIQRHPQLQHLSAIMLPHPQQPTQPPLVSSTLHTPISTHVPTFSEPTNQGTPVITAHNGSTCTPPSNALPQTATTPLEHFAAFAPSHATSQHPSFQSTLSAPHSPNTLAGGYAYPQKLQNPLTLANPDPQVQAVMRSPTVTVAGMTWDTQHSAMHVPQQQSGSSLRQALLSQVNNHVEAALTGQKILGAGGGGTADAAAMDNLGYVSPKISQTNTVFHTGGSIPLRPSIVGMSQQLPHSQYPVSFTGASSSLPHTISYQGHDTAFPHPL